jgi:hypothetical protein
MLTALFLNKIQENAFQLECVRLGVTAKINGKSLITKQSEKSKTSCEE